MISQVHKKSNLFKSKCNCNESAIIFLQKKQMEMLSELHQEIASLQRENSDLKFQIYMKSEVENKNKNNKEDMQILKKSRSKSIDTESKLRVPKLTNKLDAEHSQINLLEQKLSSMAIMLENSVFLQAEAGNRNRVQQMEIKILRNELEDLRMSDFKNVLSQTKTKCHTSRSLNEDEKLRKKEFAQQRRRSLSSVSHNSETERRCSLILPSNYKESVATLPPIGIGIGIDWGKSNTRRPNQNTKCNGDIPKSILGLDAQNSSHLTNKSQVFHNSTDEIRILDSVSVPLRRTQGDSKLT